MYLEYFGLRESPFRITPHTDFFFSGASRGATLDALIYAITHEEGIVKVSGEVGSGKTMLCRVLIERLPDSVTIIYLANPSLSPDDILYAIADELQIKIPENARLAVVLRSLQEHLIESYAKGRQVVVLIDEAHAMPAATLEEIRLLSNLESNRSKLLQLVLFGQPELNTVLARPDMRQLKERITHNFTLEPLVRDDIASYIEFRMRAAGYKGPDLFSGSAIQLIAESSCGLTRRVNILADKALLCAFSNGKHQVELAEARAAVKDCDFSEINSNTPLRLKTRLGYAILGAAGFSAVIAAAYQWGHENAIERSSAQATAPAPLREPSTVVSQNVPAVSQVEGPIRSVLENQATISDQAANPRAISTEPAVVPAIGALAAPEPIPAVTTALVPPEIGTVTRQYLNNSAAWFNDAEGRRWFIQLYTTEIDNAKSFELFMKQAMKTDIDLSQLRVYRASRESREYLGVTFGDYADRAGANADIERLPKQFKINRPYPRQIRQLR